jgi:hypothetical protein
MRIFALFERQNIDPQGQLITGVGLRRRAKDGRTPGGVQIWVVISGTYENVFRSSLLKWGKLRQGNHLCCACRDFAAFETTQRSIDDAYTYETPLVKSSPCAHDAMMMQNGKNNSHSYPLGYAPHFFYSGVWVYAIYPLELVYLES